MVIYNIILYVLYYYCSTVIIYLTIIVLKGGIL